jgi:hypothetical protein
MNEPSENKMDLITNRLTPERVNFFFNMRRALLKPRTGWINRGIYPGGLEIRFVRVEGQQRPKIQSFLRPYHAEPVSLHQNIVRLAAGHFGLSHSQYDLSEMSTHGEVHDLPEYKMPDWTPDDKIPKEHKVEREVALLYHIAASVPYGGEEILRIGLDYVYQRTPEARIVKQLDKIDPAIRAMWYQLHFEEIERFYQDKDHPDHTKRREWLMQVEKFEGLTFEQRIPAIRESLDEFFPYARKKLEDPDLINVYDIMMKNEHPEIDPFARYFILLSSNGNEKVMKEFFQIM